MRKIALFVMLTAAIVFFSPQAGFAGLTKLWGDGLNISKGGGTLATYGYGRKASDGSLFAYYQMGDYGSAKIYIQKIDKDGHELWGNQGRLIGYESGSIVDLAPDQSGGAVAVFGTGSELRAKRFDSSGNEDTSWGADGVLIASNVYYSVHNSAVTDSTGGAIVVWRGGMSGMGIYTQRVGSDGQLKWNNGEPVWVGYGGLYHGWTQANNAISDGKGGVFIAWDGYTGSVLAQYFDANGIPQWQEGGVVAIPIMSEIDGSSALQSDIILDGTGGVILAGNTNGTSSVIVQRISSQGNLLWGNEGITLKDGFYGDEGSSTFTYIETVGNNDFVVVWHEPISWDESGIYAQKIDINGNLKWNPDGVMVSEKGYYNIFPHLVADGNNGVWVSFMTAENDRAIWWGNGYLGVQHLDNNGNLFACKPITQKTYNQKIWGHNIVSDNIGGVYILWDGSGGGNGSGDVYAQRISKVGQRAASCGVISVSIDIKPGSYPNSINLGSKGVVPVAVLATDSFDASTIDAGTVLFAGAKAVNNSLEDVNGDGRLDMVFHFNTQELQLTSSSTSATLTGKTLDGRDIQGEDSVNIVPAKGK